MIREENRGTMMDRDDPDVGRGDRICPIEHGFPVISFTPPFCDIA
jgi:hypothetical protein